MEKHSEGKIHMSSVTGTSFLNGQNIEKNYTNGTLKIKLGRNSMYLFQGQNFLVKI